MNSEERPIEANENTAVDDLKALTDEFGLRFQLADPDAKVSVEQRTINNLFFALLDARNAVAQEGARR